MPNPHFVYMLLCQDGTLYTGYTTNLARRLDVHNRGKGSKYTRARLPVQLVFVEQMESKSMALKREHAIKRLSRAEKMTMVEHFEPFRLVSFQMEAK